MDPSGSPKSVILTIGHGRVPTIFWGTDVPGAEVWPAGETSTSLDPDGCLVRRHDATVTETTEDTDASETARGGRDAMQHTSAKKMQKVCFITGHIYKLFSYRQLGEVVASYTPI
jgi:hypothetical protein